MCDPVTVLYILGGGLAADEVFNDGKIRKEVVNFVIDEVIDPVMTTVSNVIEAALDNPVKTIAQIAAIATGNVWALPLIEGADVAVKGGDLGDVVKAVAISYVAQNVGQGVGKAVGNYVSNAGTALEYGASQGSQQAAMLAAQEAGMQTASQIAGRVVGSAAAAASVAVVTGQDPVKAFVTGGIGAAVPTILGSVPGFTSLPPSSQQVIAQAVKTQLAGGNVTAAIIGSAIQTSGIVTDTLKRFDPDGTKMTDAQRAIATDVLMGSATAALTGKNIPKAMQNAIMQNGVTALGDMVTSGFKTSVDSVSAKYTAADKAANAVDANIAQQEKVAQEHNTVVTDLNNRVAEQDRLKAVYDNAVAAQKANPSQATTDAANAAARTYNDYVTTLNADYTNTIQPKINQYAGELAKIQETYGNLEQVYINAMEGVADAAESVKKELKPAIDASNKAFVEVMAPNFNADEYRKINNLGANDDPYEHWLSKGQFEGVKTNDKDVAVQEAVDKYEATAKEPIPPRVLEAMTRPENQGRDKAVKQYVDTSLKDREVKESFRESIANSVLDAYQAEGFSSAQIDEKIDSGETTRYINGAVQRKQESIAQMQEYTKTTAEKYGADSTEYKNAYRDTLSAMAEVGGYGVVKDGDSFVLPEAGKLNPDTLRPSANDGGGYAYVDPVTGIYTIEAWLTQSGEIVFKDYSSLWALGKSANPPTQGGNTVFGDGSGVSAGLFGGIMPIAIDDKSGDAGAKMYGAGNGFALIAYSDGRGAAINTKTQEVIWVSPADMQKLLNELPEPKPPLPVIPKPNVPVPEKPVVVDPVKDTTQQIKDKIQSPQEVIAVLKAAGYNATPEEAKQFAGEKTAEQLRTEVAAYADPRVVDEQEVKDAYAALGLQKPTTADVQKLMGQYAETDLAGKAKENLDPARYNSLVKQIEELATQSGVDPAVLETIKADLNKQVTTLGGDIAKMSSDVAAAKTDLTKAIADAQKGDATRFDAVDKAITDLKAAGLTTEQVQKIVGDSSAGVSKEFKAAMDAAAQGNTTALGSLKADLTGKLAGVQKALETAMGSQAEAFNAKVADLMSQGQTYQDAATAAFKQLGGDVSKLGADFTSKVDALTNSLTAKISGVETNLLTKIAANEAAGQTREQATQKAITDLATELGTSKAGILTQIGATEATLNTKIADLQTKVSADVKAVETNLLTKIAANEAAGQTREQATQKAITDLATELGTSKADVLSKIGTTEAALQGQIAGVSQDAQAKFNALTAEQKALATQLTQQGTDLAAAVAQAQAQTQGQIAGVTQDVQTKFDALSQGQKDLARQLTDQGFDLNTAIGLARQETQQGFADVFGTMATNQAATQKAIADEAEATRQAQAAQATATRNAAARNAANQAKLGNVNSLMQMLGQSSDTGGQQVTVKQADPAKIGYVYDFNSIFANPSQEKMFVSPYAQGGMVDGSDDVNEELLKLLKG